MRRKKNGLKTQDFDQLFDSDRVLPGIIASWIKQFRQRRRERQVDLATAVGLSHRHLQKIEAGQIDIKASTIRTFAKHFNTPPCYLLRDRDKTSLETLGLGCTHAFLDMIHVGFLASKTNGEICFANKKTLDTIGLTAQDLRTPKFLWDYLFDPADGAKLQSFIKTMILSGQQAMPYYMRIRSADNSPLDVKWDWNYIRDEIGHIRGMVSIVTCPTTATFL